MKTYFVAAHSRVLYFNLTNALANSHRFFVKRDVTANEIRKKTLCSRLTDCVTRFTDCFHNKRSFASFFIISWRIFNYYWLKRGHEILYHVLFAMHKEIWFTRLDMIVYRTNFFGMGWFGGISMNLTHALELDKLPLASREEQIRTIAWVNMKNK